MNTDHRLWPVPSKPWRMKQTWHNLLFAHWPIRSNIIEPLLPPGLELDLFEGEAWIGIVPFHMSGIRLKNSPPVPFTSSFAEINVRTYVTIENKPGVYFFSLDAANLLAVQIAKYIYHLPYFYANIKLKNDNEKITYYSKRRSTNDSHIFNGSYWPTSEKYKSQKGTLEHWLTERYCFYTGHKGRLLRCDILHEPWNLQHAEAEILQNTLIRPEKFKLPDSQPLLHYSERIDVLTWGLEEVMISKGEINR